MDEFSVADQIIAFVAIAGIFLNTTIMLLSRRGQVAKARADDADAYESLSATVGSLSKQVADLRRELDIERRARELAEEKVAVLQTKIEELEARYHRDVTRLESENSALIETIDHMVSEE